MEDNCDNHHVNDQKNDNNNIENNSIKKTKSYCYRDHDDDNDNKRTDFVLNHNHDYDHFLDHHHHGEKEENVLNHGYIREKRTIQNHQYAEGPFDPINDIQNHNHKNRIRNHGQKTKKKSNFFFLKEELL